MEFRQGEVAHLRQRIEQEECAARLGLIGLAQVATHEAINARAQRGARRILQLVEQGHHAQAIALMEQPYWEEPEDK